MFALFGSKASNYVQDGAGTRVWLRTAWCGVDELLLPHALNHLKARMHSSQPALGTLILHRAAINRITRITSQTIITEMALYHFFIELIYIWRCAELHFEAYPACLLCPKRKIVAKTNFLIALFSTYKRRLPFPLNIMICAVTLLEIPRRNNIFLVFIAGSDDWSTQEECDTFRNLNAFHFVWIVVSISLAALISRYIIATWILRWQYKDT